MEPHLATRLSEKVLGLKLQQGLLENQSFFTTKAKHHHGFTHKTWTSKQTKGNADQQQQQLESLTSLASFSDTKDLSIRIQTRMKFVGSSTIHVSDYYERLKTLDQYNDF
ncbi:hypothetical protein Bca52824_061770 [Brassica carinata]|uniref:Uncharacterized protein n=1 Tax=Brassica carinata TaxID=52824 RepID=A0A8X7QBP8_BRACI|nr:hypothetical protein Bca52824_061770 [Brassica carinata]